MLVTFCAAERVTVAASGRQRAASCACRRSVVLAAVVRGAICLFSIDLKAGFEFCEKGGT